MLSRGLQRMSFVSLRQGVCAVSGRRAWSVAASAGVSPARTARAPSVAAPWSVQTRGVKKGRDNPKVLVTSTKFNPEQKDPSKLVTLHVRTRPKAKTKKFYNRKLQANERVPGSVLITRHKDNSKNREESFEIDLDYNHLLKLLTSEYLMNQVYKLSIDDGAREMYVAPSALYNHPQTPVIHSITFTEYIPFKRTKVDLLVRFDAMEECNGLKQGGILLTVDHTIPVWFKGGYELPKVLVIDMEHAVPGNVVRMKDEYLPPGCQIRRGRARPGKPHREYIMMTMQGKNRDQMLADKAAAEAAARES